MEIRKAIKNDMHELARLAAEVMAPQFKNVGEDFPDKKQYEEVLRNALDSMEFIVVGEEKGKIIGFLHWYYQDNQAFIEDLVIESKFARKGFGSALIKFLIMECKRDKIESISSLVPFGSPGIEFSKKFGFRPVSVELKRKV